MKKSILIVLGVIVFVGLTVPTVSAKVITMDGVKYQLFQDPDSGEYTLLPLNQPKTAELKKNVLPTSTSESSSPLGSPMDASENNGIIIPFGVISESPDKSEVIEKTESDSVYYEYVCTVPSGCPFKDGKCVGCKKIKVFEEKTVIKLPKKEPEIDHTVLPKKEKFFGIPEGNYHWRHMTTIIGSEIWEKSLAPGFLANYKEVVPGSYLITTSGAAEYTSPSFTGTKVIACPIPSTKFATIDKDGVSEVRKTLVKGTCWNKYPNNTISFRYYNVDANTIKTVWVRKHTTWIVGCEDCEDTIRTDISTFVKID
jgi:hypothetical protein